MKDYFANSAKVVVPISRQKSHRRQALSTHTDRRKIGKRRFFLLALLALFVFFWGGVLLCFWLWRTAITLVEAPRTPIPDYLQAWIKYPEQHGMSLQNIPCGQGKSRCFIALPDKQVAFAERGVAMRQQLQSMSVDLPVQGTAKGILVLLHGRGSRKAFMLPIAERFVAAGFICVMPDLPAHGEHIAKHHYFATTADEARFVGDVLADARKHLSQKDLPAAVWAMSLGTAFANRSLATDGSAWQAAVILSGFDDLNAILADKLDFLPDFVAKPMLSAFKQLLKSQQHFDTNKASPKQWATQITQPILSVHGDQDQLIRPIRGKNLFSAYAGEQKTWVNVPSANHHNILVTDMPLYATMGAWLLQQLQEPTTENN